MTIDHLGVITGSLNDGGWRAEGNIYNDADRLSWYQEVESWFWLYRGGGWEDLPRPAFRGHLLPEAWEKTAQSSVAPWRGFTAQEILKRGRLQGIFFAEAASPSNQHQLAVGDTLADVVKHLLGQSGEYGHWNGAVDIWPEGFARLNIETANSIAPGVWDLKEGNFWTRLQEIALADTHLLYVSKDNIINYIRHPMFGTLPDPVMTLTSSHLLEPLQITRRNTESVGKQIVYGTTPGGLQISGGYPTTDITAGPILTESGVLATSSTLLAAIAERKYKYANRDVSVVATLPGAMGLLFDIMDRVAITYTSSTDGVSWSAKKFWIEEIRVTLKNWFSGESVLRLEAENA